MGDIASTDLGTRHEGVDAELAEPKSATDSASPDAVTPPSVAMLAFNRIWIMPQGGNYRIAAKAITCSMDQYATAPVAYLTPMAPVFV